MKDPLRTFGEFLEKTDFRKFPKGVRDHAKIVLLDTIGAILGGMGFKEMINLSKSIAQLSRPGPASVFGRKMKIQPPFAALMHGTAGTWLELDEGNRFARGHPGIHVVPAALAMGEALKASGKEFLTALILGYEVAARVGAASKLRSGVQPHGTWGTPGAAVAAGKLLGLKSRDFHSIINLSATFSIASTMQAAFEGATIRNAYAGLSGYHGLLALEFHRSGFTGEKDGLGTVYGQILSESFDHRRLVQNLGRSYEIGRNYFKMHACCRYNHSTLDALEALRKKTHFKLPEVERIEIHTYNLAASLKDPNPSNMLASKFSVPYAAAAYLALGSSWIDAFEEASVKNPQIRRLVKKIDLLESKEFTGMLPEKRPSRVIIHLRGGGTLEETVFSSKWDPADPYSASELKEKFLRLSERSLGRNRSRRVMDMVMRLDEIPDINYLTKLLRG